MCLLELLQVQPYVSQKIGDIPRDPLPRVPYRVAETGRRDRLLLLREVLPERRPLQEVAVQALRYSLDVPLLRCDL